MKKNLSWFDRAFRFAIAIEVTVLFFYSVINHILGDSLMVVAILFAITGISGYCPTYKVFNITTLSKKDDEQRRHIQ